MDDKVYNRLVNLIKLFKNRPNHLAKYLIDNRVIDNAFLKRLMSNSSLDTDKIVPTNFTDINQLNQYFNSLVIDFEPDKISKEELGTRLNKKLDQLIREESYEDAIRVRDYMISHDISRISNNNF